MVTTSNYNGESGVGLTFCPGREFCPMTCKCCRYLIPFAVTCVIVAGSRAAVAQSEAPPSATEARLSSPSLPEDEPSELPQPVIGPIDDQASETQSADLEYEPLLQGPVHEAFATPINSGLQRGRVSSKPPPGPVDEQPPTADREHAGMNWIPGYWAWDDETDDYVWVSGMWRRHPPGRTWVPGYWSQTTGGYRRTTGYWGSDPAPQETAEYLPQPPASIDNGPSTPPPIEGCFWVPGHWEYVSGGYRWRGGFWSAQPSDWVWQPTCYIDTPRGCRLVHGYWDYLPTVRGHLYAPVRFSDHVYRRPHYVYRPRYPLIHTAALLLQLFARPGHPHYFYGNYYGPTFASRGYRPWYDFGYGHGAPWLAYYDRQYRKLGINFTGSMRRHANTVRVNTNHRPQQPKSRSVVSKQALANDKVNRSQVASKGPKRLSTFDEVVRSDAARVKIPTPQKSFSSVGRSVTGPSRGNPRSAQVRPPGQTDFRVQSRPAPTVKQNLGSPFSRGFQSTSSPAAQVRGGFTPSHGGPAKVARPTTVRPKGSFSSPGRQGSFSSPGRQGSFSSRGRQGSPTFSRGGTSPNFSGNSRSAGKSSKSFGGGFKRVGKGKK